MKVCVSTVYDASNCGAFLQAYALKKTIESMGHEVVHLQYLSKKERKHKLLKYNEVNKIQYLKRHFGFSYKNFRMYNKAIKCFNTISADEVINCDCLVIGSDELWNVTNDNVMDYLNRVSYSNDRKYGFAVSCGKATYEDLIKYPDVISDIKSLDRIYPRDQFSKEQIEKIIDRECKTTCDPCFLMSLSEYPSFNYKPLPFDYIMYYGYWSDDNIISHLKKYSEQQNVDLCSIGLKNYRINKNYLCHPFNFPWYIEDSKLMVTSTFHGTIFSILTHSNFVCIDYGRKKIQMLLKEFGLENRLLKPSVSYEEFLKIVDTKIDFSIIDKKIDTLKTNAYSILSNILSD